MKFHPHPLLRFCYRYSLLFILIVLPLGCAIHAMFQEMPSHDRVHYIALCIITAVVGCILIHIGFWEKCFSTLILTDTEIRWTCPFRKTRIILLSQCVEIGAYMENENNGIPSEQIYFSDHPFPKRNMNKQGVIPASSHLIKFWYSDQLCEYILKNYPGSQTSCLLAYRVRRKKTGQ